MSLKRDLAEFVRQTDQLLLDGDPETLWRCEETLRSFIASNLPAEVVRQELRCLIGDPGRTYDWQGGQLRIHRGRNYALSLGLLDGQARYIHTVPFLGLYAPIGVEELRFDVYRLPQSYRNEVFDPSLRLEPAGSGVAKRGEIIRISDKYTYDFRLDRPVLVLRLTTASVERFEWLFRRDNLQAWQVNDSELSATQLRVAAYVLGRLRDQSSVEPLAALSSHPHHGVRWAAIEALGRIDGARAMTHLKQAQSDAHPHIRAAAAKTLSRLGHDL